MSGDYRYLAVMAYAPQHPQLPGNDGRWYLELVGVVEPDPDSTDTYAALEALEPPAAADPSVTMSAAATAAMVHGALVPNATPNGEFVPLVERGGVTASRREHNLRRLSWLVPAGAAVLVVAALSMAVYLMPKAVEDEAAVLAARHRTALSDLRTELPTTQAALADLTDPGSDDALVAEVPQALSALGSMSGSLTAVATAPLPSTLPLVPRTSLDALEPTRETSAILAGTAGDLADRMAVGFAYRSTVDSLFAVGDLPSGAPADAVLKLSIALASDLAETGRLVADLPAGGAFSGVRDAATAASGSYATWQLEYLDALRGEDADTASRLIDELGSTVSSLASVLNTALAAMRAELDPIIVELAAELERAIDAVPTAS